MSSAAVASVRALTGIGRAPKLLLMALAGYADDAGQCSLTMGALAGELHTSPRQVRRLVAALVAAGLLCVAQQWDGHNGGQSANQYELLGLKAPKVKPKPKPKAAPAPKPVQASLDGMPEAVVAPPLDVKAAKEACFRAGNKGARVGALVDLAKAYGYENSDGGIWAGLLGGTKGSPPPTMGNIVDAIDWVATKKKPKPAVLETFVMKVVNGNGKAKPRSTGGGDRGETTDAEQARITW